MIFKPATLMVILSTLLITGCGQDAELNKTASATEPQFETQVIYGSDDRRDWYEADPVYQRLAQSTVGLFYNSDLVTSGNKVTVRTTRPNWCSDEPFQNQGTGAFCSGFLVGPDLLVTAGHCIRSQSSCRTTKFAFGFALKTRDHDYKTLSTDDVYSCGELLTSKVEGAGADYAVVRLDRPVKGYQPLPIRRSGSITRNTELVVIGHPAGLPSKIADNARVRSVNSSYFVANLDTYGGNSGSAVFNTRTLEVEGILVRGDNDFIYSNGCRRSNVCADGGCRGEDVTKIDNVLSFVPALTGDQGGNDNDDDAEEEEPTSPSTPALFHSNSVQLIPDNSRDGLLSTLDINQAVMGRKINVHVNITHPYVGDLSMALVSPTGKAIVLRDRQGGSMRNLVGVFGQNLVAQGDLNSLANEPAGRWQLFILDLAYLDSGRLNNWALEFK